VSLCDIVLEGGSLEAQEGAVEGKMSISVRHNGCSGKKVCSDRTRVAEMATHTSRSEGED